MSSQCPICFKKNLKTKYQFRDKGRDIKVLFCKECDFEYLDTWEDVDFVKSLYSVYYLTRDEKQNAPLKQLTYISQQIFF